MATRIFWRQTKRGVRLCVRDRHFETAIASVETGFGFDFESGTRGFEVSASPSGFSHGHESWKRLGTVTDIEVGKKIALTAEGVVRRIGIEQERGEAVLALNKVIALPGPKAGVWAASPR